MHAMILEKIHVHTVFITSCKHMLTMNGVYVRKVQTITDKIMLHKTNNTVVFLVTFALFT